MTYSELKNLLLEMEAVELILPNGKKVPPHFHLTEVGKVNKEFIDCGGKRRSEDRISLQIYLAGDFDHRLKADKLLSILEMSEKQLGLKDSIIEVEFQSDTIGKYGLEFNGNAFQLSPTHTDCLAKDQCGIPEEKQKLALQDLGENENSCCSPGSGCC